MDAAWAIAISGIPQSILRLRTHASLRPYKITNSEPMLGHTGPTNMG
jgi:hypothetical protein